MQYMMVKQNDAPAPTSSSTTTTEKKKQEEAAEEASTAPAAAIPASMALVPMGAKAIERVAEKEPKQTGHRRHKRARAEELLVKVRVGDGMVVAKVEDISVGGLFARTQKAIPVGAYVEMALLRPGHEELALNGVVVDDMAKRSGMAVKFESLSGLANAELRRIVLDQQVRNASGDPDADVEPTRVMRAPSEELTGRDRELDDLRRKVALLTAENERLKNDAVIAEQAHKLVGKLQLEIERMKSRVDGGAAVDVLLLSDIKRDAETAWTAIARLTDNVDKIK